MQCKAIVVIEVVASVLDAVLFVCLFSFTAVVESSLSLFLLLGAVFFLYFLFHHHHHCRPQSSLPLSWSSSSSSSRATSTYLEGAEIIYFKLKKHVAIAKGHRIAPSFPISDLMCFFPSSSHHNHHRPPALEIITPIQNLHHRQLSILLLLCRLEKFL